jgi:uncharacterized protein YecE (DUF72 family)
MSAPTLCGAASWSNRSLVHESRWYPKRSMKAAERMAYYAERLPLVEIDATLRFPPTPDLARQWVERTPLGFTVDVQAWSLLTGAAALPDSLWEDLRDEVRPDLRDRRRLYAGHLSDAGLREAWDRFEHAIRPLADAGRLGAVVLRYPHWLKPGDTGRSLLAQARRRLPDYRLAVELGHSGWVEGDVCEETLAFLEAHELAYVCLDGHDLPPVVASTADVAVVRFLGRDPDPWESSGYRYSTDELRQWEPKLRVLAEGADVVHVLFSNTWRDCAVTNAEELQALLGSRV